MSEPLTDNAESIRHRLRNRIRERGEDVQFGLQRYAIERFLYRLGVSSNRERFVLKGASLFGLWGGFVYRPTRDLDFAGYGSPDAIGDDKSIVGIEPDRFENEDKFMLHLSQVVRNGLGDRASTCIDPKTQIVQGKTICVISCQRSPEPVFLKWKGMETSPEGDFYVRSGPGSVRLAPDSTEQYIQTRFPGISKTAEKRKGLA